MINNNTKRATKGVKWSAIERFLTQGVQFVVSIILARLLLPSDFGLIALVLVILNILQTINETGFGVALMQKLNRDELDFSTVFMLNMVLGITLYLIVFTLAPILAIFFEQPQLTYLIRLVGLNLIVNSFTIVHRTKLIIIFDFKTQAKASLIAAIISGAFGIYCAYNGFGAFSLVYQSLANIVLNTLLIWFFVRWQPRLQFSYIRFKLLFSFAYKLILARMINVLFQESFSAIIGKVYSPVQLGYFNRSNSFLQFSSSNITGIVQRVSTPMLCESQNDHQQMGHILTKFITSTAMIVYPLLFGVFVLAKPLIIVLLTDKWLPSVWILKVLCPVGLFYVVNTFNKNVFNATGRTDWALENEIINKIIFIVTIFSAVYFGFVALIYSQLVMAIVEFFINTHYTKKQIGLTLFQQMKSLSGIFAASALMACIMSLSTIYLRNNMMVLVVGLFTGIITFIIECYVFNLNNFRIICQNIYKKDGNN
jgi:O-antigen/teichoic acid export membrane protein